MGKLHDQMKEDLLLKAYSPHTQRAYLRCARQFASHYLRSPEEMGEQGIRRFYNFSYSRGSQGSLLLPVKPDPHVVVLLS